jgi:hypothetical protein
MEALEDALAGLEGISVALEIEGCDAEIRILETALAGIGACGDRNAVLQRLHASKSRRAHLIDQYPELFAPTQA